MSLLHVGDLKLLEMNVVSPLAVALPDLPLQIVKTDLAGCLIAEKCLLVSFQCSQLLLALLYKALKACLLALALANHETRLVLGVFVGRLNAPQSIGKLSIKEPTLEEGAKSLVFGWAFGAFEVGAHERQDLGLHGANEGLGIEIS